LLVARRALTSELEVFGVRCTHLMPGSILDGSHLQDCDSGSFSEHHHDEGAARKHLQVYGFRLALALLPSP
jgi:hypothetical protein